MQDEIRFLPLKELCARIGVSKSTLYKMIREGKFPESRQLGPNTVRWRSDEVTAWIMARQRTVDSCSDNVRRAAA